MAGPCGELLLEDTGVVDLRDVGRRDCLLSVGRPLGEVLEVKVVSSSLNCKESEASEYSKVIPGRSAGDDQKVALIPKVGHPYPHPRHSVRSHPFSLYSSLPHIWRHNGDKVTTRVHLCLATGEFVLFYEQLMLLKKCERLTGYTITSRSNVLMIRQGRLAPGRGILLHYWSKAATKRHHSGKGGPRMVSHWNPRTPVTSRISFPDCDVQLFGVTGKIVNPIQSQALGHQSCRTFVNVAPRRRIEIRALSMNMAAQVNGSYILIRDVDIMRTWVFHGNSLFFWRSSGSRAEIEFHGEYLRRLGTFHGEFSAIEP
ncbi:ATS13 metalloproteinase, partial [Polypterus senegalus]